VESINERIARVMDLKADGNRTRFGEILGTTPQYVAKIIKEGGSVGIEPVTKILRYWPDIDARWLILGEGDIYGRSKKEEEARQSITDRLDYLTRIERYIPVMSGEELEKLGDCFQNGKYPDFPLSRFSEWELLIREKDTIVKNAMDKGVCKTKSDKA
jgi:hypothetical protein